MEFSRRLVLFPSDQFYAVVGDVRLQEDPYQVSIPDIFNEKSRMTHWARDHEHRSGKLFLSNTAFYDLADNRRRVCPTMTTAHLPLASLRAVADYHPENYIGSEAKRLEFEERISTPSQMRFTLNRHTLEGTVCDLEVYRRSEQFVGVSRLRVMDHPTGPHLSLPAFFEEIGCPQPEYMAVHLGNVFHS